MKIKIFLARLSFLFTSVIPATLISSLFVVYTPLYLVIKCFKLFHYDSYYDYSLWNIFDEYKEVWKRIWDI